MAYLILKNTQGTGALTLMARTLGGTGSETSRGITVDSSGNIYIAGETNSEGAGGNDIFVAKYNASGEIQWQKLLGGAGSDNAFGIVADSAANVYICGRIDSQGAGLTDAIVAKYNTSGALQWQKTLGGAGDETLWAINVDSADNLYAVGLTSSQGAGGQDALIIKFDGTGALLWQRTLGGANFDNSYGGIATDASNNVCVLGTTGSTGAGGNDAFVAKYNSSGVIQWQRALGGTNDDRGDGGVAVDSSNNVYVCGRTNSAGVGSFDMFIAKYNSSGVIQWQRTVGGSVGDDFAHSVAVDSSYVYLCGQATLSGPDDAMFVAKFDLNGNIQWQRTFYGSGSEFLSHIDASNQNVLYATGRTSSDGQGNFDFFLTRLPKDGTGTGAYGNLSYQTSALTNQSSSLTDQAIALTDQACTLTYQTCTLTDQTATLIDQQL